MTTKSVLFGISLFLALSHYGACLTDTWYVNAGASGPRDGRSPETGFQRIQQGIDAASDGDTVTVAEGTYVENIKLNGKNVVLTSTDPFDPAVVANTVIDGNQAGSVVTFSGAEDETCVLSGFTIRNGNASAGSGILGGGPDNATRATIRDNVITGNGDPDGRGDRDGGGLAYCSGAIQNNTISGNYARVGGGLCGCDGFILGNRIVGNHAQFGGGLCQCGGIIRRNTVIGNVAEAGAGLGGCAGSVEHNIITGNHAWEDGGGLYRCDNVRNNTVFANRAKQGGGLFLCEGLILNCIIWENTAWLGAQLLGSSEPTYSCIEEWMGSGGGNIAFYPYFVNAGNGDFHLMAWSPSVDAGDPSSPFSNEPEPNGGRVNIGAYGNTEEATVESPDSDGDSLPDDWELHWFENLSQDDEGDPDGDHVANIAEYQYGRNPALADGHVQNLTTGQFYMTIGTALLECSDGDELVAYPGTYYENITFAGKNVLLRSTDPSDPDVVASTIIDGRQRGPVVSFSGTEDESCVLAGFTIVNGFAEAGGGILGGQGGAFTSATIRNNVISQNSAEYDGGGIYGCLGRIENNTISDNTAAHGGGLYACGGTVRGNLITRNTADEGGGLHSCHGVIQNNAIALNTASGTYAEGAGLYACDGTIESNTIFGNAAVGEQSMGAAISNCEGVIKNCIIWGNKALDVNSMVHGTEQIVTSSVPTYSCIQDWTGAGEGNIPCFPYFVDSDGEDYHLMTSSPCIDVGDPGSAYSLEPLPNGGRIDMGAYGNTPEATSKSPDTDGDGLPDDWETEHFGNLTENGDGDPDGDLLSNLKEYRLGSKPILLEPTWYVDVAVAASGDGMSWETAFKTIQEGIDVAADGDATVVAPGTYVENIHFRGNNISLLAADLFERGVIGNTVVDGSQAGPVVTFSGTERETCLLAGFVIRNGKAESGGGICGGTRDLWTRATIMNNIIALNSGGGIGRCVGTIQNNTICCNVGGGVFGTGYSPPPARPVLKNCIIWGNSGAFSAFVPAEEAPTYCCIEDWIEGGEGNISSYPYFVDPANGDFRLRSWSPCIDAGDPLSDFSREPDPNGGRINMGAYGNTALAASRSPNTDNDGLPDDWEIEYFAGLAQEGEGDPDDDGFSNIEEYRRGYNPSVPPATWYVNALALVSGDGESWATAFKTIQEGIVAASDGDIVVVAPGIYVENIQFRGKNIVLTSTDPLDPAIVANTVIDGNRADSVVTFSGTEDETSLLSGFTIRNGGLRSGAGISGAYSRHALATIQYNVIVGNSTSDAFGDIYGTIGGGIAECDGLIQYNTIYGNISSGGGGIADCDGTIRHNTISGNAAGQGGGYYACDGIIENNVISYNLGSGLQSCEAVIRNNTICRNSGGGLRGCSGAIVNCMIYGNWNANLGGGLLYCWGPILNCTIVGNRAYMSGGGLYSCAGSITNCVIWGNSAPDGAQFDLELTTPPTYSCIEGLTELSDGNTNSDPLFTNPAKYDYHLLAGSPCINAGTNEVLDSLQTDIDGEERPFGLRVDIGADEYVDSDGDDLADRWEMIYLGTLGFGPSDDPDADGLTNGQELQLSTDPNNEDTDDEGLKDGDEVYAYGTDPTLDDTDGDGLKDDDEVMGYGTDPNSPDSDADGMPDGWEKKHGLHPMKRDADDDPDRDGLTNLEEYFNETNPQRDDTEGDGIPDGWEVEHGLDPRMNDAEDDPDDDGLANLSEYQHTTDPNDDDTDRDTLPDGWEVEHNLDPLVPGRNDDPDGDGLSNLSEYLKLTDPLDADTDDDTMDDGDEVFAGTDPLDPESLFRIVAAEGVGTGLRLEWSVVTGRQYQVYKSADLTTWNPYLGPMSASADDTSLSVLDPKALGQRRLFFRVEVLP